MTSRGTDSRLPGPPPLLRRTFLPASTAIVLAAFLLVPLPWVALSAGEVVVLDDVLRVGGEPIGEADGAEWLVALYDVRRSTPARMLRSALDPGEVLRRDGRVLPPGESDDEYERRQRALASSAAGVGGALALREAGYDADPFAVVGDGVVIREVLADSPASDVLEAGDVIRSFDGVAVRTQNDLVATLIDYARRRPRGGEPVSVELRRDGRDRRVTVRPRGLDVPAPQVGIVSETMNPRVPLPIGVEVTDDELGGSAAGLGLALATYDALEGPDLAGGRRIGVLGTLEPSGAVVPVAGVEQRSHALLAAGVDVIVAPAPQHLLVRGVVEEEGAAGAVEVLGVRTFSQALADLRPDGAV